MANSMLDQQLGELVNEEKTEEQVRMEKYIVENVLDSDESQNGNSSSSSYSDLFSQYRAPANTPKSPTYPSTSTTSFAQSGAVFSFPPPVRSAQTMLQSSRVYSSYGFQPSPNQEMNHQMPVRMFSLPAGHSSPISIPALSSSSYYAPISRSQSSPPSPSLFRTFNPSSLPLPSASSRVRRNSRSSDQCGFCKRNGEIPEIYQAHRLSDSQGRVLCPQLRVLVCDLCGATGDTAHTRNYCPSNLQASRVALPTLLKSTPRQSDGRWRRRGGK